jgi:hypothetical protein
MEIGIPAFRDPRRCITLPGMLAMPFVRAHEPGGNCEDPVHPQRPTLRHGAQP